MHPALAEDAAFLRWLTKPRTPRDIMNRVREDTGERVGYPFVHRLPPNTMVAMGVDENGVRRSYYWLPNWTDRQAKLLGSHEIDGTDGRPIRPTDE